MKIKLNKIEFEDAKKGDLLIFNPLNRANPLNAPFYTAVILEATDKEVSLYKKCFNQGPEIITLNQSEWGIRGYDKIYHSIKENQDIAKISESLLEEASRTMALPKKFPTNF